MAEIGLAGKNGKGNQAYGYKQKLISSEYFSQIDAGICYIISNGRLHEGDNIEFRIFVKCIPDTKADTKKDTSVLDNVITYLSESHYKSLCTANARIFGKDSISSGKDLYDLLVLDTEQLQNVGDSKIGDAQGHAFESVCRTLLTKYIPDGGEYIDLRQPPYSVDADFGIRFDSKESLSKYYQNLRSAERCFEIQTNHLL